MNGNTLSVLAEVAEERERQDAKWGEVQDIPMGTGANLVWPLDEEHCTQMLALMRSANDGESDIPATFATVLAEEFYEAMLTDPRDGAALRDELIQVAAVAVKTVEHIDRRSA